MQEEMDEFFKKIFFTIENFQKKDLLGKKKTFLMKKRPIFGSILKKSVNRPSHGKKDRLHGVHFHWGTKYPDNPDEILTKTGPIS